MHQCHMDHGCVRAFEGDCVTVGVRVCVNVCMCVCVNVCECVRVVCVTKVTLCVCEKK